MKKVWVLAKNELRSFAHTPFALIIFSVYLFFLGMYFYAALSGYMDLATPNAHVKKIEGLSVHGHLLTPFFQNLFFIFILLIPLLTMRTFAEEKKLGNFDLLLSYPIRPLELLVGKYLGVFLIAQAMLALSLVFPAFIIWRGEPIVSIIWTTYLGYALFITVYTATGVVISLFTENQIVAAVITYIVYLFSFVFRRLAFIAPAPFDHFFQNFLVVEHLDSFRKGFVLLGDLGVYVCLLALVLLIGHSKLRRHFVR